MGIEFLISKKESQMLVDTLKINNYDNIELMRGDRNKKLFYFKYKKNKLIEFGLIKPNQVLYKNKI